MTNASLSTYFYRVCVPFVCLEGAIDAFTSAHWQFSLFFYLLGWLNMRCCGCFNLVKHVKIFEGKKKVWEQRSMSPIKAEKVLKPNIRPIISSGRAFICEHKGAQRSVCRGEWVQIVRNEWVAPGRTRGFEDLGYCTCVQRIKWKDSEKVCFQAHCCAECTYGFLFVYSKQSKYCETCTIPIINICHLGVVVANQLKWVCASKLKYS